VQSPLRCALMPARSSHVTMVSTRPSLRRSAQVCLLVALAVPTTTLRAAAPCGSALGGSAAAITVSRRAPTSPAMLLELPRANPLLSPFGLPGWPASQRPEVLYEGGTAIDFTMESVHFTKRRVSGGVFVRAPPEAIWRVLTAYERLPEVVPNILSNVVTRDAQSGRVTILQESLLSRRMNLHTSMTLEAVEQRDAWQLLLRRVSGHGFLEFEGKYNLRPRPDGSGTYLSYSVELVPCPIFPLPMVERKIRKEVPKMLAAVASVARRTM